MDVEWENELGRRNTDPEPQIDRSASDHPAQVHRKPFARAPRRGPGQMLPHAVRGATVHCHQFVDKSVNGRSDVQRVRGEVVYKSRIQGAVSSQRHRQHVSQPDGVRLLKRSVDEAIQPGAVPLDIEPEHEVVGSVVHPLTQRLEFGEKGFASAPCQNGRIETDHLAISRILEAMRNGYGIARDEGLRLVLRYEDVEIGG